MGRMPFSVLFGPLLDVKVYAYSSLCPHAWHSAWGVVLIANTCQAFIMYKALLPVLTKIILTAIP